MLGLGYFKNKVKKHDLALEHYGTSHIVVNQGLYKGRRSL